MLSSFAAQHLRPKDRISVQTLSGKHAGTVTAVPEFLPEKVAFTVRVSLDCTPCSSRHAVELSGFRLIAAERTP